MKPKKILLFLSASILLLSVTSCKKDSKTSTAAEIEATFDLTGKQAISESLTDDANNILNEVAETQNLSGSREPLVCMGTTTCAQVSVSPGNFPKTITLDFGTSGCSNGSNSVVRRGIVRILLTDSLRRFGSKTIMTFENYYVNNYKKEADSIKWTNTSSNGSRSWNRIVYNGKITAPDGRYWLHISNKNITQVAGVNTPRLLIDDAYSITGTATITNSTGNTRDAVIINPLHKQLICEHVDQGTIRYQGNNHFSILDFGAGTCDAIATISIDGYSPRTITLP
jgi:hypothetical protein